MKALTDVGLTAVDVVRDYGPVDGETRIEVMARWLVELLTHEVASHDGVYVDGDRVRVGTWNLVPAQARAMAISILRAADLAEAAQGPT